MDRRQKKTREAIFGAFEELLKSEVYSRITVQQIIDRADIGRTTFYAHFETKDDLLKSLCSEIFDHVFSEELNKERTHDFSQLRGARARLTHILYHLREHMAYLPGLLSEESGQAFMGPFKAYLAEMFAHALPCAPSVPRDYMLNHMVCDFAETVRWWAKHSRYSPEEVSGFFFATIPAPGEDCEETPSANGAFPNFLPKEMEKRENQSKMQKF